MYVARLIGDSLKLTVEMYGRHARIPARDGGPNLLLRKF
jgi:hypothetical protein